MSLYTVRKVPAGELCGTNLTVTEAATLVLNYSVDRSTFVARTQATTGCGSRPTKARWRSRTAAVARSVHERRRDNSLGSP
jgi:hypothetical protein